MPMSGEFEWEAGPLREDYIFKQPVSLVIAGELFDASVKSYVFFGTDAVAEEQKYIPGVMVAFREILAGHREADNLHLIDIAQKGPITGSAEMLLIKLVDNNAILCLENAFAEKGALIEKYGRLAYWRSRRQGLRPVRPVFPLFRSHPYGSGKENSAIELVGHIGDHDKNPVEVWKFILNYYHRQFLIFRSFLTGCMGGKEAADFINYYESIAAKERIYGFLQRLEAVTDGVISSGPWFVPGFGQG